MAIDLLNGLVSYWKLDEPGGVRYDAHGPNHLAPTNAPGSAAGVLGNAASFDETKSQSLAASDGTQLQMTGPMTIAAWAKPNTVISALWPIVVGKWITQQEYVLYYYPTSGTFIFSAFNSGGTQFGVSKAATAGQWHLVVAWYDGANINIQVDNGTPATVVFSGTPRSYTTPFRVGGASIANNFWDGQIDEVLVYNRELTSAERSALYNNGAGLPYHKFYDGQPAAEFSFALRFGSTWTDISDYVIDVDWQLGFTDPYEVLARAETLNLTVRNTDKRFSPENASGPYFGSLTRSTPVRVQCTFANVTRNMFFGQIDGIEPAGDTRGDRRATIRCGGILSRLQRVMVNVPTQENVRANDVAAAVLNDASFTANASGRWLLGVVGVSELGSTTELGDGGELFEPETGISLFTVIGDQWSDETTAYGALRDVAGQEYGRVWVSRAGRVKLWNRHHFILHTNIDDFLSDGDLRSIRYSFGDDVINEVVVAARPRVISSGNEVLAKLDAQSILIKPNTTKSISFRYEDSATGLKIGGKNAVTPVKGTDYNANSAEDGSGTDMLSVMSATITDESSTSCRVDFQNASTDTEVWLQPGAQLRGIKITDYGQIEGRAIDQTSVDDHGLQRWRYPYDLDDAGVAQSMADFLLSQRSQPAGLVKSITLAAHASGGQMYRCLARSIGQKISLAETQIGLATTYFIIAESWRLADRQVEVTWQLAYAETNYYWILGLNNFAELGTNTRLGPL